MGQPEIGGVPADFLVKPYSDAVRANPLTALRRHPEALSRIEAALGRTDFNAWGASALTAFAADCAVLANEAFGQSLLARGLALTGDAAAAAAALPQPAGLNPVEIDQLRQARRRTVFLARWLPLGNQ